MPVVQKTCTCTSEFQDRTYGNKVRVFNTAKDGKEARCTVCGKTIKL